MKHDDGTLSFGTAIDTSDFDAGIERIEGKVSELTSNVEVETSKISQLLTNVPTLNIDVVSNASQSLSTIETAFAEIDRVRDLNAQGIRELEAEYQRLGQQGAAAFNKATKAGDDEFRACQRQQQAIQQVINARKRAISEANKQFDSLVKLEQQMKKEAVAAEKAANSQVSIRTRLRQLREELVMMEAAGQRGTAQYKVLQDEAGKLTDAWADATAQANILAHDQRGMQGLISGISGVAGAFSVAQGTMSLFAGENEDLQKIMVKVQSLMAITIGLQQIQQTLNKDSAFTLVTLNGLKEWWNNLLAVGIGEQTAETAATAANTAAQGANTAATIADTAAQAANNAATNAGTAATGANTAGQIINTGAAKAGTIANIGLAGAFRMVGAAIKSIPVFGWILAAIGALIGVISHFIGKSKEADKEFEEQQEILKAGREAYAKASMV